MCAVWKRYGCHNNLSSFASALSRDYERYFEENDTGKWQPTSRSVCWSSWEDTKEDATAVQKNKAKHCCTFEVFKRALGCSKVLLAKCSVDRRNQRWVVFEGTHNTMWRRKRHSTSTSKPQLTQLTQQLVGLVEVWGFICCLSAGTDCYDWQKNEFPSLQRHFKGVLKAICPPTEVCIILSAYFFHPALWMLTWGSIKTRKKSHILCIISLRRLCLSINAS